MIRKSLTTIAQYLDIQGSRKSGFPEADEHSVFDVQKLIDYKEQYDEIFSDAVKGFLEDLSTIDVYSVKKVSDPEYQYDLKKEYAGGIFIVFTEDFKTYLIDTQGYDYMRYIYRIKNLDLVNNK